MTNRHITATVDSAGQQTNDLVIDTETGQYVSTEEVDSDTAELLGLFGKVSAELDGRGDGDPEIEAIAARAAQFMEDNPDFGEPSE